MEDSKIVQLFWARDQEAIAAAAQKYGGYCTAIAMQILGSAEDAEECVNDAYLHAWNAIPPHRPEVLSTFLGKITRNLALNRYKHNHAGKRGGGEAVLVLDELAECLADSGSPEQEVSRRALVDAINAFLGTLPADKRGMFICRYWYFDSVSAIAARYGMSANQVSVTLSRLRAKLHHDLEKEGFGR